MAVNISLDQLKFNLETQAFIEQFCGENLSESDLLEIKESLHHLGKAIYLYHLQKSGGGNE